MSKKYKIWLSAFRLRTLPLSLSGIIIAASLAAYNGVFDWLVFVLAILTTLSLQILSNLANDYGDGVKGTDRYARIRPQRFILISTIIPYEMIDASKINILFVIGLCFVLCMVALAPKLLLLAMLFFGLCLFPIYAAIKYTAGKNAYSY